MVHPIALITGASRGIGRAVAEQLSRAGADLILTARTTASLEEVAAGIRAEGRKAEIVPADLRNPEAPTDLLEACGALPDLIVNNAGTAPSAKLSDTSDADLEHALDLHLRAPFRLLRAALPGMARRGSGCAIQMGSTAGLRGFRFTSAYTAAKHAMIGLTRALHEEFAAKGVKVHAVCPGFVDTDITRDAAAAVAAGGRTTAEEALARMGGMNRIGRMHSCDEVARAVVDLWQSPPEQAVVVDLDAEPPRYLGPDG